jgi:hypothetical protein
VPRLHSPFCAYVTGFLFLILCFARYLQDVIGWLKSITNLPIIIKGILTHEDGMIDHQLIKAPSLDVCLSLVLYLL